MESGLGPVATVEVSPASATLITLGETVALMATAKDAGGTVVPNQTFTWTSSADAVGTVDQDGVVAAEANGEATITATVNGKSGSAVITVATSQIRVSPDGTSGMAAGGQVRLTFPAGAVAAELVVTVDPATGFPPTTNLVPGTAFDLGPDGTQFNAPVELSIGYSGANIPSGVDEAELKLYRVVGEAWEEVPGSTVDATADAVSAAIDGFSTFGTWTPPARPSLQIALGDTRTCATLADGSVWCWGNNNGGVFGNGTVEDSDNMPVPGATGLTLVELTLAFRARNFACGIDVSGSSYCWGVNDDGQLGNGTTSDALTPQLVSGGLAFRYVSAGGAHVCGLTAAGDAYCWGRNVNGQLGDGTTTDRSVPTPVTGGIAFQSITAGADYTCGLDGSGVAYCWGENGDGQVGDGMTSNAVSPVAVSGGLTFAQLDAGDDHTCGVTTSGSANCWGDNGDGQLGDGTTAERLTPTPVAGGLSFAVVIAGSRTTCGIDEEGVAYCWGENGDGQLGLGHTDNALTPEPVTGGLLFRAIEPGEEHSCGITTNEEIYCWGHRGDGAVGDAPITYFSPVSVVGGLTLAAVTAGDHSCGLTADGDAHCWGGNDSGQLGDGTFDLRPSPAAVQGGLTFDAVSSGADYTCGVTGTGEGYCWGSNVAGQLGDGSGSFQSVPVAVDGMFSFRSLSASAEAGAEGYTCGVTTADEVYCWGNNVGFQFGDGTQTSSDVPVRGGGDLTFRSVSTGGQTCAVGTDGMGYCWGTVFGGGGTEPLPALVSATLQFESISVGDGHSCGVTPDGEAYCWGSNSEGQFGDGSVVTSVDPVVVAGGLSFASVSAGRFYTCGVTTDGDGYCWGENSEGTTGTGLTDDMLLLPTAVAGGLTFQSLDAGNQHACGVTDQGVGYCWGANNWAAVGDGRAPVALAPLRVVFP